MTDHTSTSIRIKIWIELVIFPQTANQAPHILVSTMQPSTSSSHPSTSSSIIFFKLPQPWNYQHQSTIRRKSSNMSKLRAYYNDPESTPRGGVNKCRANLMTNDAELKTKYNTLSVTKECSRIPGEGLWLSLIHIWRCRRSTLCRSRWSPYH